MDMTAERHLPPSHLALFHARLTQLDRVLSLQERSRGFESLAVYHPEREAWASIASLAYDDWFDTSVQDLAGRRGGTLTWLITKRSSVRV